MPRRTKDFFTQLLFTYKVNPQTAFYIGYSDESVASEEFEMTRIGRTLFVKSPEDTVLRKLLWFRQGGETSDRQWRDVQGVMRANPALDAAYLDQWARSLGIDDLLNRARHEASGE